MKHFYNSVPDFSGDYSIGGFRPSKQLTCFDFRHAFSVSRKRGRYNKEYPARDIKEVRDYVRDNDKILTIADVFHHLKRVGNPPKKLYLLRETIHFYEQTGLISFVPNYTGDELLFTNTKYFKTIWNIPKEDT